VLQLLNKNNANTSEKNYLQVIHCKTAKLFAVAAQIAAVLANCSNAMQNVLAQYGHHLGMAYQLVDDILDYSNPQDNFGKNIGDDLAAGNPTLPLIYLLAYGSNEEKTMIKTALSSGSSVNFLAIQQAINNSEAISYTMAVAKQEAEQAKLAISELPESAYRAAAIALVDFVLTRSH